MQVKNLKSIITRNKNNIAFLIGNGINHHYSDEPSSWDDLLINLWAKHSFTTKSEIPLGISLTEFYDVLEIQNFMTKNFSASLQKEVKDSMIDWDANANQNIILQKIEKLNAPILTTNFDDLIPKSMGLELHKMGKAKESDYYPWSRYYSNKELISPTDGFGVWYINGMIKYHRSIKLGLSQYMGNVTHAKKLLNRKVKKELLNRSQWKGFPTWLNIFYNKSLFIFGLGLDENEVFLRWMLIQRAKHYRKYPELRQKGWFVMKRGGHLETDSGKKFFLESVGLEVIVVDEYKNIYEDIWL